MRPPLEGSPLEEDTLDTWELAIIITVGVLLILVILVTLANVMGLLEQCLSRRQPSSSRNKSSKERRRSEQKR